MPQMSSTTVRSVETECEKGSRTPADGLRLQPRPDLSRRAQSGALRGLARLGRIS